MRLFFPFVLFLKEKLRQLFEIGLFFLKCLGNCRGRQFYFMSSPRLWVTAGFSTSE